VPGDADGQQLTVFAYPGVGSEIGAGLGYSASVVLDVQQPPVPAVGPGGVHHARGLPTAGQRALAGTVGGELGNRAQLPGVKVVDQLLQNRSFGDSRSVR
jgi:hypothetical protein